MKELDKTLYVSWNGEIGSLVNAFRTANKHREEIKRNAIKPKFDVRETPMPCITIAPEEDHCLRIDYCSNVYDGDKISEVLQRLGYFQAK